MIVNTLEREGVLTCDVEQCSFCGLNHEEDVLKRDEKGYYFMCTTRTSFGAPDGHRVDVEVREDRTLNQLEEHRLRLQALMKEAVAPLLERLDLSERNAAEYQAQADELARRLREKRDKEDDARLADARRRFRVSLAAELSCKTYTSAKAALGAADDLLEEAGCEGVVTEESYELERKNAAKLGSDLMTLHAAVGALMDPEGKLSPPEGPERATLEAVYMRLRRERGW